MWSFLNVFLLFLRIFHWGILRTRFICKEIESEYWCHVVVSQSDHSHSSVLHSQPHSKYRTFDTYSSGWCWLLYQKKKEKKYGLFVSNLCLLAILCLRFIDLIWNIVFTWLWLVWLFMWLQIWEGATCLNLHSQQEGSEGFSGVEFWLSSLNAFRL